MADLQVSMQYYGISPWEVEVLYGFLNSHFEIKQDEIDINDEDFVSFLDIDIPLTFNDQFFQWFEFKRWDKVKSVFKEMKRRRGSGNALKIQINFSGNPKIVFTIDSVDKQWFDNAIEKIDSVLELLPYHLDPEKVPQGITEFVYKFDSQAARWKLFNAKSDSKNFVLKDNVWKETS